MTRLILSSLLISACCFGAPLSSPTAPQLSAPSSPPTAFTADPHSFSKPGDVRVEHVALDLHVDFGAKRLSGTATLHIKRVQPSATTLTLDTQSLTIRGITLEPGSVEAKYTLAAEDPILGQALTIALGDDTSDVVIAYATSPTAKALQWLEPAMTAGKQHPFLLSQSEAILARSWVPLQDSPQVRFTYDATLHVPKELLALMSAENPQQKTSDGVYHFHMPQPVPSYLMAIAVGDLAFERYDDRSGIYAEPSVLKAGAFEFSETPKMIAAAEKLYGPYRWGRYDLLVLPPSFPYGGMENPRLTFLTPTAIAGDKSLVELVAHELAHSWSGNLVTNATWNDFWLNEGFTTYFQHRITEELYGRGHSEMLWLRDLMTVREDLAKLPPGDQQLYLELAKRDPDDASSTVYEKGALFLRTLEQAAGRERWDQFLRVYFDSHAFQPMTTTRFIAYLKQQLPKIVDHVKLDAWIYGPGIPDNAPTPKSDAFARVEAEAKHFAAGDAAASLTTTNWSSHEWLHFISSLPALTPERMAELDARFHFSDTGNNEVLAAWLLKAVNDHYVAARPAIERFLTKQGRRKFLRPLYQQLSQTADDLAFAKQVYAKARPTYHPVSQGTIDAILKK
jgi:leukotriene-A4 hydrolase